MKDTNRRTTGTKYESLAALYLEEAGYEILERNVYLKQGEIDIVALAPYSDFPGNPVRVLTFIEVKYRKDLRFGDPLEAITNRKKHHMVLSAMAYIKSKGLSMNQAMRFDVIGICGDGRIRHVKNAIC